MSLERLSGAPELAEQWCQRLATAVPQTRVLLLLAGTGYGSR